MKTRNILLSTLALSLLAIGIHTGTANASSYSTSYAHPYNALNSYITLGHFHMVNNGNYSVKQSYSNYYNQGSSKSANRHLKTIGGNWSNSYRPFAQLDDSNLQSTVIKPNGTMFVASDANGDSDTGTKTQIARYNIKNRKGRGANAVMTRRHLGPVFHGGHGQALAWNPKTNQLWLEYNIGHQGSRNSVRLLLINQKTLKPEHQVKFNFEPYAFGAVLAFDSQGNAYNAIDTFHSSYGGAPVGSLKIYKGIVTKHNAHFHMVQGLRHYPGAVMQNMSYNPSNHRLYFLADGDYMSVPAYKLGNGLKASQVHATKLNEHYEPEDLAFYHGNAYLLVHHPGQLLISNGNGHRRGVSHKRKANHRKYRRNHKAHKHVKRQIKHHNRRSNHKRK